MTSVDPRVYDLARLFLADVKDATLDDVQQLANQIQETIEAFTVAERAHEIRIAKE